MATPNVPRRPVARVASARPPGYFDRSQPVALRSEETRAEFITKTYLHLFGAVLAFTLLEMAYFLTGLALPIAVALLGTSWLLVLGGFVVVSWLATRVAHVAESPGAQYAALGAYVIAESIIFVPLLLIASRSWAGCSAGAASWPSR
jgi:FtsH-binding integral membrane protein